MEKKKGKNSGKIQLNSGNFFAPTPYSFFQIILPSLLP